MFSFVENQKKWVQIGLVAVSLPFVATGMMGYVDGSMSGGSKLVQMDGGRVIPEATFEQRWANYRQSQPNNALKMQDQKQMLLDALIDDQLFTLYAHQQHFFVTDEMVRDRIAQEPAFRDAQGHFSLTQYKTMLRQSGRSETEFELSTKEMMARQPVEQVVKPWLAGPLVDYLLRLYETQRVTRRATVSWERYAKDMPVDDTTARAYYAKHKEHYLEPLKIQIESLESSPEIAEKSIAVTPEALVQYYEQHKANYLAAETRQVRHILLKVDPKATAQDKDKKKIQIEVWLKELQAAPEKFAAYAKQYSEDPGSASQGGDLGDVGRGAMVKPFEDAAFKASANTVVGPIETEFGYHLIQVGAIHAAEQKTLESVKAEVEQAVRREQARAKQEAWMLKMDQASDDLSVVAKDTGLQVKRSEWMDASAVATVLEGKHGLAEQLIENAQKGDRHPLPVQELSGQRFILVRAVAYQAAHQPAFEAVKAKVVTDVQQEKGIVKAREEGAKLLKALEAHQKIATPLEWSAPEVVVYQRANTLTPELQAQVMQLRPKGAPLYAGANAPNGYTLVAVDAVINPSVDEAKRNQARPLLARLWAEQGRQAFAQSLRKLYSVKVNEARWKTILSRHEEAVAAVPSVE